ncbi:hypothetical protein H8B02_22960 [Bradyrhizobium sp. Pear77]|uniref:hypothetical protein n=1 Tax=Bradyrhizobium altum TaxID=1571202 RepID=UPI001E410430|nr:hypothetical protein [Bradyrhizobium altum]MCC8956183.1 hypothetical protein [Bradyrhizobium altum]
MFDTADEATSACRSIVDQFLNGAFEPGMTSEALWEAYVGFGDDPFVVPVDPKDAPVAFSAWEYARSRCAEIAAIPQ